jgi:hypothetical protein
MAPFYRIAIAVAILSSILSAFLCWNILGLIPHIPDELSYLYQGRIFSTGHLSIRPPEVPEAFTVMWDHIIRDSRGWRSMYPPGWPFLLSIGWLIHAPWLINSVLLFFSVIGVFRLATQLFDEKTALFSIIAFVCSPFVLLMSAGFMSHASALCFSIWCVFFLARGKQRDFIKAGAFGAFVFLIRPYTAFALLLPALLWFWWKSKDRNRSMAQVVLGALPFLLIFAAYNHFQFESVMQTGYSYDPDATFRGPFLGYFKEHIPWYFHALNRGLWNWPWPDLLIFVPLIIPKEKWERDFVLAVCFLSLLVGYAVYYYTDIVYSGPRYIFEAMGFLVILTARALLRFGNKIAPYLLLLFLYPLVSTLPDQMEYHKMAYHGQSKELLDLVKTKGIGENSLILISGNPHVFRTFYLENSLDPAKSTRVYARDIPGLREKILKAYPRKEVWSMNIDLEMLEGPNFYEDRAMIRAVRFKKIAG